MSLGPVELLVVLAVLLLVVGPTVLPRITRNLGKSIGSFQRGLREGEGPVEIHGTLEREDPAEGNAGQVPGGAPRLSRGERKPGEPLTGGA